MANTVDIFLGAFLIFCGFALSLFNLRRVLKDNTKFSAVLLSENIILMCIGIIFMIRAVNELNIVNAHTNDTEERVAESMGPHKPNGSIVCGFQSVLMSYGPLIISLVNSFLSLIIDNYMHYKMIEDMKEKDNSDNVQEIDEESINRKLKTTRVLTFWKKYFSYVVIVLQWLIPVLIALTMYPMGVNEMKISLNELRSNSGFCMAVVDHNNETCTGAVEDHENYASELRKYFTLPKNYVQVYENEQINGNTSTEIDSILRNVIEIISNYRNDSSATVNVTNQRSVRKPKLQDRCMKVCYVDNRYLLLYMFTLAIISYFVPITISTVILTKIHVMEVTRPNIKTYVSRELLYNILFWTPVMLDTFLSLIMCSYSMNGMKTSLFNIIANVYQAVKNFMNTKYFKDNTVTPV